MRATRARYERLQEELEQSELRVRARDESITRPLLVEELSPSDLVSIPDEREVRAAPRRSRVLCVVGLLVVAHAALDICILHGHAPASSAVAPPAAVMAAPLTPPVASPGCSVIVPARVLGSARAVAPLELSLQGSRALVGFASDATQATALEVDATSLAALRTTKVVTLQPVRRVLPQIDKQSLEAIPELTTDAEIGALVDGRVALDLTPDAIRAGARTLHQFDVPLPGDGLRAAKLGGKQGTAITYRRDGAVWLAAIAGDKLDGPPMPLSPPRGQVGLPSIAALGETAIVSWAEKTGDAYAVRWLGWKPSDRVQAPRAFTVPPGGAGRSAMSPSVSPLSEDRFVLVWTEGPPRGHQVRAQLLTREGAAVGEPIVLSPAGANAGQGQVAMGRGGSGLVLFFVEKEAGMQLMATSLRCG
jgi:hypothetical protein